jgi:hypothetical protein
MAEEWFLTRIVEKKPGALSALTIFRDGDILIESAKRR